MAGLLVSVRNAAEARAALCGGAAVIDVKEPERGPLGRAEVTVWEAVCDVVAGAAPVSVALGELIEWGPALPSSAWSGVAFRKLGLAGSGPDWRGRWAWLRNELGPGPAWVAVAYADGERAAAPAVEEVLDEALRSGCAGILLDTWQKGCPGRGGSPRRAWWDGAWLGSWVEAARAGGLLVALAGGLDAAAIERLAPLGPDLFAVRGAACSGGDRRAGIDVARVRRLAAAARGGVGGPAQAAAELSRAVSRASTVSAAACPERMQSGTPTPSR